MGALRARLTLIREWLSPVRADVPNGRNFDIPGHFCLVGEAQRRTSV